MSMVLICAIAILKFWYQILFEIVMLVGMLDSLNNVSYRLTQLTMAMNQSIYDTMLVKPKCISENLFIISVVCLQFKENYLFVKAFWLYLLWVRNALAIYNLSFLFWSPYGTKWIFQGFFWQFFWDNLISNSKKWNFSTTFFSVKTI